MNLRPQTSFLLAIALMLPLSCRLRAQVNASGVYSPAPFNSPTWNVGGRLDIGNGGVGSISIATGGTVTNTVGVIGGGVGSAGVANVMGGQWINSDTFAVISGGTLNLSAGILSNANGDINFGGTANVTGGSWENSNNLRVTRDGTLNLAGGRVSSAGGQIGTSGVVNVTGGSWMNAGHLGVGSSSRGVLNISRGIVSAHSTEISGISSESQGSLTISGGQLINDTFLEVRERGTLNILGGRISVTTLAMAGSAAPGTINFGTADVPRTGALEASEIRGFSGPGNVNFWQANLLRLAIPISGSISVNQLGTGRTILTERNSYVGGTVISAGTLETRTSGALGNGLVRLRGGVLDAVHSLRVASLDWFDGTVAISLGTVSDFLNVEGALQLFGNGGTFFFEEGDGFLANTEYAVLGATNLTDSVLRHVSGNSLVGAVPTFTHDGLTLFVTFIRIDDALSGPLLDNSMPGGTPTSGVFTVTGNAQTGGPFDNNTIFGLIFNPGGSLQVFNTLTVTGGNFTANGGNATLTGGRIFVPGNFNKNGIGNLDLQSLVQILGVGNVNGGGLFVNGVLEALSLNILPGSMLGGAGTIFGDVQNFGNVSPGNSPGTLSIVGNFTQASSGAINLEIASLSNFDRLVVTGNAALAGTLNIIPFDGFGPTYGQQFAFLQAGSISGSFDTITAPSEFRGRLLNSGTTGTLLLAPDTYTRVAITDNQRRVARALDTFIPVTTGDRATVSLALDLQTAAQYPGAFDQIAPTLHETIADITIEQAFTQTQLLNQRMSSVRLGARGFQAIGLNAEPLRHDKDGKSVADPKDLKSQVENLANPRWSTWVIGSGMFANIRGIGQLPNLSFQSGGFLAGADYAWSENLTTGLYGGYQGTYADYGNSGDARINTTSFGAYATYTAGGFYADAVIGGGYSNYKVNRSIEFSTIDRTASSQQNGGQFTTGLNFGYDWKASGFTFGPVFGAQYTLASISPFTETGAGALNLRVAQQNANSLRTTLGGRIAYTWNVSEQITIIPEVRAFWQHEFLENPRVIGASLNSGNGPGFNYTTVAPDRDAIFTAAGLTAQFGETWNASLYYNTSFANETTLIHTISASLGWSF